MTKPWQNYTTERICENCNRKFQAFIHNVKKGYGRYCSRACRNVGAKLGFKEGEEHQLWYGKGRTWKGTLGEYRTLHEWVERQLGKPNTCESCGKSGLSGRKIHWANKSGRYLREKNDWLRLCVPCHIANDRPKERAMEELG